MKYFTFNAYAMRVIQLSVFLFLGLQLISAQQNSILDKELSITFNNETLATALTKIEKKAGCVFSYTPSSLKIERKLNKSYTAVSLRELLNDVLVAHSVYYRLRGTTIHIQSKAKKGKVQGAIKTSDGSPAAFVSVLLKGTSFGSSSNENGYFSFYAPEGEYIMTTSSMGLKEQSQTVSIVSGVDTQVNFSLKETAESLQEVVVNGNIRKKYAIRNPSKSLRLDNKLIDIPQNIQIISGDVLLDQGIMNIREGISRNVSGVMFTGGWEAYTTISMRGFDLPFFRNGLNMDLPYGPLTEDMSNVESVEFIKGPGGFMISSGEPGGFYNVTTKKPSKNKVREVSVSLASFNTYRASADFGGSFDKAGNVQYRINGMYQQNETHRKFEKNDRFSINPSLRFLVSDKTTITTEFGLQKSNMMVGTNGVSVPAGYDFKSLDRDASHIDKDFPATEFTQWSTLVNVEHKFNDNWKLNLNGFYMQLEQEGDFFWGTTLEKNGDVLREMTLWDGLGTTVQLQANLNGKFTTGVINHKILAAAEFKETDTYGDVGQSAIVDITPFNVFKPVYGNAVYPNFDRSTNVKDRESVWGGYTKTKSMYLQDELNLINDKLKITFAGRYTEIQETGIGGDPKFDHKFTPRVGISYKILSSFNVYGLFDKSFNPNYGTDENGNNFDPVLATNLEFGLKKEWLNGRLKTSLTAYNITKKNITVTPPGASFDVLIGEVESKGIEFDMQGQITKGLNVVINYAYTDLTITEDTDPLKIGTRLPGHAKHITNTWLNYNFNPNSKLKGFGASIGYQYLLDRSIWGGDISEWYEYPDYFRVDGALNWKNDKFKVILNVNNILDEYIINQGSKSAEGLGWESEPGINGRITVRYSF